MKNRQLFLLIVLLIFILPGCSATTESIPETSNTISEPITDTTTTSEISTVTTPEPTTTTEELNNIRHQKYKEALLNLYNNSVEVDGSFFEDFTREDSRECISDINQNAYAIADVDSDGNDELILRYNMYYTMSYRGIVYEYDVENESWNEEIRTSPYGMKFYDNGTLSVCDPKNQNNYSDVPFPYFIFQYNTECDDYSGSRVHIGSFDTVFYEMRGMDLPELFIRTDTENAGIIYEMDFNGENNWDPGEIEYYSQSQYDAYLSSHLGNEIAIEYKAFTLENFDSIAN